MRKFILTTAVIAAASLPSLALAADANENGAPSAFTATQLSDAEMDQVTAAGRPEWAGKGLHTAAYRLGLRGRSLPSAALANGRGFGKPPQ